MARTRALPSTSGFLEQASNHGVVKLFVSVKVKILRTQRCVVHVKHCSLVFFFFFFSFFLFLGVLVPVSDSSDVFESSILTHLQSAYLHDESRHTFRYKSAVLIKNAVLEEKVCLMFNINCRCKKYIPKRE